jgi:hypothetical protein
VPLVAIVGAVPFAEPLDVLVLGGAAIILLANVISIAIERGREAKAATG